MSVREIMMRNYKNPQKGSVVNFSKKPRQKKVAKMSREIKYLKNMVEDKFLDTTLAYTIDSTGELPATGQLCLIPQGDSAVTRDGRKVVLNSLSIKAELTLAPGASATLSGTTSIMLVLDREPDEATAVFNDVYLTGAGGVGTISPINLNNANRFVILKRWDHIWNPNGGVSGAYNTVVKKIDYYKKLKGQVMNFNSTTGAIAEITGHNIFLLSASSAGLDDLVTVSGVARLRFTG